MPRAAARSRAARNTTPRQRVAAKVAAAKEAKPRKKAKQKGVPRRGRDADVRQERLDFIVQMIGQCKYKGEMKRAYKARFGGSYQTFEDELTRARAYLRERHEKNVREIFDENIAILRDVARDGGRDAIAAVAETNRMFGLNAPEKHDHTSNGAPIAQVLNVRIITQPQDQPKAANEHQP